MGVGKCRIGLIWALGLSLSLAVIPSRTELQTQPATGAGLPVPLPPMTEVVEGAIQKNTTLVATLVDLDIPAELANDLAHLVKPVFDVRKIRFGNLFRVEKEIDGSLKTFEYKIDDERVLKVEKADDSYAAKVEKLDFEVRETVVRTEIRSSL